MQKFMTDISITKYSAICSLGNSIDEIFHNALLGHKNFTFSDNIIQGKTFPFGMVKTEFPDIEKAEFNIRGNKMVLHCLNSMSEEIDLLLKKYKKDEIGIVIGTTNSGIEDFQTSGLKKHTEICNHAEFVKDLLGLKGFFAGVSTACTSGVKAFSLAQRLLKNEICQAVIVGGVDSLAKLPCYGFHSLEVLSDDLSNPFSKNRKGINIGEGAALFILEKHKSGINLLSMGETSDAFHAATPNPEATQAKRAIEAALKAANLLPKDIDYINLHGTGTIANDAMEAKAVNDIFGEKVICSSTKPLTGHCLGASASIETALCCKIIEDKEHRILPHIYDGEYDTSLPKINLAQKDSQAEKLNICMSSSFGFGGTNSVIILGKNYD